MGESILNLSGKHIFILGASRFDTSDQSTTLTISKLLAKNNSVYYLDYPYTWKDYFSRRGTAEFKRRKPYFSLKTSGLVENGIENFNVIILPVLLSINFLPEGRLYRRLLRYNETLIQRRIRQVIRARRIDSFIYINSFNFHYPDVADGLNPDLTVYQCVDPMIMPYDKKHGIHSENKLVRESDLVICTSKQLYEEKKLLNTNTFFVPNAADIRHSSKALNKDLAIHPSIAQLPGPIIGYIGTIERRMDYDLLKEVIESNPDKTFVFAGPTSTEYTPAWFFNTPNIFLPGRIDYMEIPAMMKGFDIALIPFKKDKVSATIFPLKLFEYLGAGKPVIASNFNPDLQEFTENTVEFCSNASFFNQAINNILNKDSAADKEARLLVAEKNTWEKRAAKISTLIYKMLLSNKH